MTVTPVMVPAQPQAHVVRQQQQQQQSVVMAGTSAPQSSLIKSLLANKVTTTTVKSPVKTVGTSVQPKAMPQFVQQSSVVVAANAGGGGSMQDPKKTPFFINPTNTNLNQPPAGAVAAASVIMSNVAAQSGKPTASVPISNNNSNKLMQSPNKTLIGHPPLVLSSPISSSNNPTQPNVIAPNAMNVRQVNVV